MKLNTQLHRRPRLIKPNTQLRHRSHLVKLHAELHRLPRLIKLYNELRHRFHLVKLHAELHSSPNRFIHSDSQLRNHATAVRPLRNQQHQCRLLGGFGCRGLGVVGCPRLGDCGHACRCGGRCGGKRSSCVQNDIKLDVGGEGGVGGDAPIILLHLLGRRLLGHRRLGRRLLNLSTLRLLMLLYDLDGPRLLLLELPHSSHELVGCVLSTALVGYVLLELPHSSHELVGYVLRTALVGYVLTLHALRL